MPYILKKSRPELDVLIKPLAEKLSQEFELFSRLNHLLIDFVEPGVLNYTITKLLVELKFDKKYINYNAIMGALSCLTKEYYRREVAPYEDEKIKENGDVFKPKKKRKTRK